MRTSNPPQGNGFTLIEAILYTFLYLSTITLLTIMIINFSQLKNTSKVSRETYQEARYLLERINNKIRLAPGIDTGNSAFDDVNGTLVLKTADASENPTIFRLENGDLMEQLGGDPPLAINSPNTTIEELTFRHVVSSITQSSIETEIQVSFNDQGRSDYEALTVLKTQASLRTNFPYAWSQTDWSNGGGQAIWSDPSSYESDDNNVDFGTCEGDVRLGTDHDEIVIHVADLCAFHGEYEQASDALAADDIRADDMPDLGLRVGGHFGNAALSAPEHYFDASFNADAGQQYHIWARMRVVTTGDAGTSDSLYVQFNDALDGPSGDPVNRIGTNQGLVISQGGTSWAWDDIWTGTDTEGERFYLESDDLHTLRVQRREDGFGIDQIIVSSGTYLNNPPGNGTIVPRRYAPSAEVISSAFDTGVASVFGQLMVTSLTTASTRVRLQLRTADTEAALATSSWNGPTGPSDYYEESGLGINALHDGDQWIQYRAVLETTDVTVTPTLNAVTITYAN